MGIARTIHQAFMQPPGSGGTATVQIGPDYGHAGKPEIIATLVCDQVGIVTELTVSAALTMDSLSIVHDPMTARCDLTMGSIGVESALSGTGTLTMPTVSVDGLTLNGTATLDPVQVLIDNAIPGHDTWVDAVVGCASDSNHNATDLQVDSTATSAKEILLGWATSDFPSASNWNVIGMTLTLNRKATSLAARTLDLFVADATFDEATAKCSNRPDSSQGLVGSVNIGTTTGEKVVSLDYRARLKLRQSGGTQFPLLVRMNTAVSADTFESADEGTGDANGPRLDVTFLINEPAIDASDDFNGYADGNLDAENGGSGWQDAWDADTGTFNVQGTTTAEGSKAIEINTNSSNCRVGRAVTTDQPTKKTYWDCAIRRTANNAGSGSFLSSGSPDSEVRFDSDGNIKLFTEGALKETIQAYSANRWYQVRLEIDGPGSLCRARIDDGPYTAWYATSPNGNVYCRLGHSGTVLTPSTFFDLVEARVV